MTMQCLCQICNCGKHHCPWDSPGSKASEAPDTHAVIGADDLLISEYKRKFTAHPDAELRSAHLHQDEYRPPQGKMADMTTFRFDYVPHPLIPRKARPQSAYVPPEGTMRTSTTYSEDFHRHALPAQHHRTPARAQEYQYQPCTDAKMDGLSTYKDEYRTWPPQRRQPYRIVDNLTLTTGRFCGTSTFKDDYQPIRGPCTRQPCKPPPTSSLEQRDSAPFTATTNYRLHYVHHPAEALQRPSSAPMQQTPPTPTPAFQGTTEFRDQYQAWPVVARQQRPAEMEAPDCVGPRGPMAFHSTTHADYVRHECPGHPRPVVQAWGAESQTGAHLGVHPGATSRGRVAERRGVPGKKHHMSKTPPPTAGAANPDRHPAVAAATTTYRSQFTPKTTATAPPKAGHYRPPQARKPGSDARHHPGVEGHREVKGHDTAHAHVLTPRRARTPNSREAPSSPCPASLAHPPGFQDTHTTLGGHRMYRTLSGAEDGSAKGGVATATSGQSQGSHRRGHSDRDSVSGGRTSVVVDGRGRGQR